MTSLFSGAVVAEYEPSRLSIVKTVTTSANTIPSIDTVHVNDGSDNINVTYDLVDIDDDNISLSVFYSIDNAETWTRTTNILGDTKNLRPGANKSFIWLSSKDTVVSYTSTEIKVVPFDGIEEGTAVRSNKFALNVPAVSNIVGIDGSGDITLSYTLLYGISDIEIYFSKDDGQTWKRTENITGQTKDVSPGTGRSLIWNSSNDVFSSENAVKIKIIPFYGVFEGISDVSNGFSIDNNDEPVDFNDPNLETALRSVLEKPFDPIYQSELAALENLNLSSSNVYDISVLEKCINLKTLDLSSNTVEDLSPIASLTQLSSLIIYENNVSDIEALMNLDSLEYLDIDSNDIADLSPLEGLVNLVHLDIGENPVDDIGSVSYLTKLEYFRITNSEISDLSSLSEILSLKEIDAENNEIDDLNSLRDLWQLEKLNLGNNEITDITPLADLQSLKDLTLQSNNITDISSLYKLTQLEELWISYTEISDISVLSHYTEMKKLYLGNNQISNIDSLETLTLLNYIDLSNNSINDISPLVLNNGISSATVVYLNGNDLDDAQQQTNIQTLEDRGIVVNY